MNNGYAGESWSKKYARASYWLTAKKSFGDAFGNFTHCALSSREAGDHFVGLAFGLNVTCVDIDGAAIMAAKEKGAAVWHGDIAEYVERFSPNHVFLDFCSTVNKKTLEIIERVARAMPNRGYLGIAAMYGRDEPIMPLVSGNRSRRRQYESSMRSTWQKNAEVEVKSWRRLLIVHGQVLASRGARSVPHVTFMCQYKGHSVPMFIVGMTFDGPDRRKPMVVHVPKESAAKQRIRNLCVQSSFTGDSHLYNVPAGTIAAWRAHETRGTYRSAS